MLLFDQAPFCDRNHFGDALLNKMGLNGIAVEIGTHQGEWAERLLATWSEPGFLHCIDPWTAYDPMDLASHGDREADFETAKRRLGPLFCHRHAIHRMTSAKALSMFQDESLDFVYVDGCHQLNEVEYDLWMWWSKVKCGGVLAGHDFVCPGEDGGGWGRFVQPVVLDFAQCLGLTVHLVPDSGPWSYYFIKS